MSGLVKGREQCVPDTRSNMCKGPEVGDELAEIQGPGRRPERLEQSEQAKSGRQC